MITDWLIFLSGLALGYIYDGMTVHTMMMIAEVK